MRLFARMGTRQIGNALALVVLAVVAGPVSSVQAVPASVLGAYTGYGNVAADQAIGAELGHPLAFGPTTFRTPRAGRAWSIRALSPSELIPDCGWSMASRCSRTRAAFRLRPAGMRVPQVITTVISHRSRGTWSITGRETRSCASAGNSMCRRGTPGTRGAMPAIRAGLAGHRHGHAGRSRRRLHLRLESQHRQHPQRPGQLLPGWRLCRRDRLRRLRHGLAGLSGTAGRLAEEPH